MYSHLGASLLLGRLWSGQGISVSDSLAEMESIVVYSHPLIQANELA